jgi:hypothetical protein
MFAKHLLYHFFFLFFALAIFQIESHIFAWGQTRTVLLLPASYIAGITGMHYYTQLIG